jgi:hypothetical protein
MQISRDRVVPLDIDCRSELLEPLLGKDWWIRVIIEHPSETCNNPLCHHGQRTAIPGFFVRKAKNNAVSITGMLHGYLFGEEFPFSEQARMQARANDK